jgi:hypothetical protein
VITPASQKENKRQGLKKTTQEQSTAELRNKLQAIRKTTGDTVIV